MYANLRVVVQKTGYGGTEEVFCHKVERREDGKVVLHIDRQDGSGNYAEPGGTRELGADQTFTVQADF